MRSLLVVLIGVGWIGCGPFLAWFMSKRGYDAFSWLAVGSIAGPSALAMALSERRAWTPTPPDVIVRGATGGGSINILVFADGKTDVVPVARPLIEWFGGCVGRLSIVRVLPEGGPLEEQPLATGAITDLVERMEPFNTEGVLLFGSIITAIRAMVREGSFHVVVTAVPIQAVREALTGTDVLYVDGPEYVPELSSGPSARHRNLRRTTTKWTHR